jgi:predicted CXXCH cytochrome family protein
MHPVGPTTRPVPAELLHTGDESARNEVTCLVCHRAHGADQQALLEVPGPPANLCRPCHPSQEAVRAGPHDLAKDPRAWPAASAATGDVCLACHRIHGTGQMGGFRMGLARGSPSTNAPCLPCHPGAAPGAEGEMSLVHPGLVAAASPVAAGLPVTAAGPGQVTVGCGTCHDPHASGAGQETGALLLRAPAGGTPDGLCLACHKEAAGIHATDHGPLKLKTAGFEAVTGCRPCHLVHADERAIVRPLLWSAPLAAQATWSPLDLAADRYCVCCHRGRGPAAVPPVSTHPTVLMFNVTGPDQRGFLPLFGPADQVSPFGSLSCRTCHLAHGRGSPTALRLEAEAPGAAATQAGLWYLRTFTHESLCVNCHGVEALRRFLFFHDLQRRKGGMWFDPAAGVPPPQKQP